MRSTLILVVALLTTLPGCSNWQVLEFEGGAIGGSLRAPASSRFTSVTVMMDGEMAKATVIALADGTRIPLADVTPELLLQRARIDAHDGTGARPAGTRELAQFESSTRYSCYLGQPPQCGPVYLFEVEHGCVVSMGAGWATPACESGHTAAVFIDSTGTAHALPLSRNSAERVWGPPVVVRRAHVGGL